MKRPEVTLSPNARLDYLAILEVLTEQRFGRSEKFATEIDETFERLALFPEIGKRWLGQGHLFRTLVIWDYSLFYSIRDRNVIVERIIHGARDIEALFDQD